MKRSGIKKRRRAGTRDELIPGARMG